MLADPANPANQVFPACGRCGAPAPVSRRPPASRGQDALPIAFSDPLVQAAGGVAVDEEVIWPLCSRCRQRLRRAEYFRMYYESNRDRILVKNRRWAKDNRDKLVVLRQARRASRPEVQRLCVDCGAEVARASRCRRCSIRYRYAHDASFRERRLAITRRWLERRTQARV